MKTNYTKFKLYLEGKEVDFRSANLTESGYAPATCIINFPTSSKAMSIKKGTIAHLFYYYDNEFRLVFEGELVGKSFNKTAGSEEISLQFEALINVVNRTFKKAVASISLTATDLADFLLIDSSNNSVFNFPSPEVTSATDGFDNFLLKIKAYFEKISKGLDENSDELLKEGFVGIIEDAELTNEWFKYFSTAFDIKDRLLVFPNSKALSALHLQAADILNRKSIAPAGNAMRYLEIIYRILQHLGYVMIQASSPQYGTNLDKSYVFLPNSDYLAPLRCNIFFGDTISNVGFSKNDKNEPTRLSVKGSSLRFLLEDGLLSVRPTYFAPSFSGEDNVDEDNKKIDYSNDEQLFGIVPAMATMNGIETAFSSIEDIKNREQNEAIKQKDVNSKKEFFSEALNIIKGSLVNDHAKKITFKRFWDMRYENRQFNVSAPYSPFRAPGFAGLFIDENMPAVAGMIKSIVTQISAEGQAVSNVMFIKPRIVWDWDLEGTDLDDADRTPSVSSWFDKATFGFDNIGKEVYNKVLGIDATTDQASVFKFKELHEYNVLYDDLVLQKNEVTDIYKDEDHELYNTVRLSAVVQALKNHYYKLSSENKTRFLDNAIYRDLPTEEHYWDNLFNSFDKINPENPSTPKNYKESDIYRDYKNNRDEDYISVKKESYSKYKPFTLSKLEPIKRINNAGT